jgi:hypothetical protein
MRAGRPGRWPRAALIQELIAGQVGATPGVIPEDLAQRCEIATQAPAKTA